MIRPDPVEPFNPVKISSGMQRACLAGRDAAGAECEGVAMGRLCTPGRVLVSGASACRRCVSGPVFDLAVAATRLEA